MAWSFIPKLWRVRQDVRADTLNVMVNAIAELQAAITAVLSDIATLKTVNRFMESARATNLAIGAAAFTTVTTTVVTDPGGLYDGTIYTVPQSGTYMCVSKVRPLDASAANNICQGVHTSNVDGPWMVWNEPGQTSTGKRSTIVNARVMSCTAGDQLRLYTFGELAYTVLQASLVIYRIGS